MGLTLALQNALSGLRVSQQSFSVLSQNIANTNNENYSRQVVKQASQNIGTEFGAGVYMTGVSRIVDDFISSTVVTRNSDVTRAETIKNTYEQAQLYLGQPGQNNSIDSYMNTFFNAMSQLSVTPERSSIKLTAVNAASSLTHEISSLSKNLENLRLEADKQISASVDTVNNEILSLWKLNKAILSAKTNGNSVNGLMDEAQVALKSMSEHIDITYRVREDGTYAVSTKSGHSLLDINPYELEYTAASSLDEMINDSAHNGIKLFALNRFGERTGDTVELVTSGISSEVTTRLTGGKIKGLLEVRDNIIPDMVSQLDNLASSVRDKINAIHNNGSGYPPLNSLTGTRLIAPTESHYWSGSVMIASLNAQGTPYQSAYASDIANGIGVTPLTLDLSKMNTGQGPGKPSMQGIIDEINRFYGVPKPRTSLTYNNPGSNDTLLTDIKLAAVSDSLTGGAGTFTFDFDLSNLTSKNANVVISNATINSGNATVTSPGAFPTTNYEVAAGKTGRTGNALQFDLNLTGAGNVSITFDVQVTDSDGNVSTSTVSFTIPETTSGMMNDRIEASSVTGDAEIEMPVTTQRFMTAKLVDANGLEILKDPATGNYLNSGYLVIEGNDSSYRVAISELDSKERGDTGAGIPQSGWGFSHYFGLNDFFVSMDGETNNAAVNFKVRDEIQKEPQRLSTGTLTLSSQPTDPTALPRYTYLIANGSNQTAAAMAELGLASQRFSAAGSLPELSLSFSEYAAEILGFAASATTQAQDTYEQENLIIQGFVERDRNIRGVNIDEEMANTIIFQNAYSANARVITTAKEMFDTLLQAF